MSFGFKSAINENVLGDNLLDFDDDTALSFGASDDASFLWETADADANYLSLVLSGSNNFIISADNNIDWGHANSTDPTLFIHSADETDKTKWLSFTQGSTTSDIKNGKGTLRISGVSGVEIKHGTARSFLTTVAGSSTILLPSTGNYMRIGDAGTTSHSLNTNDDLMVTGKLEVDGSIYLDGVTTFNNSLIIGTGKILYSNTSYGSIMLRNSDQTPDTLCLLTGSSSNSIIIAEYGDRTFDFSHAQQTDPTLFIHSANQSTTEWVSLAHDQTDAVLNAGTGTLKLASSSMWQANGTGTVTISNVAPAGVGTATISKWLAIKDDTGTVMYIPAWT